MHNEKRAIVILTLALMVVFIYLIRPFWYPIALGAVITVLCHPLHTTLTRWFRDRRRLAALAATLVIFVSLILPISALVALFVDQAQNLLNGFDIRQLSAAAYKSRLYQDHIVHWLTEIEHRLRTQIDVFQMLNEVGRKVAQYVYTFSPQVVTQTANFVFSFFIMLISIYVFFVEGPRLLAFLVDLSPLRASHDRRLLQQFKDTIHATVYGYILTALVQGILAAIGFAISGASAALVLGVLTFFASMVPLIGAAGVWIPVALWHLSEGRTHAAIGVFLYGGLVISGIDNILKPLIIRDRIRIHLFLIFLSLFGGIIWLGPIGILAGPMITAMLAATLKIYREECASK